MKRKLFSLFIAALCCASMWATEGALSGRFTINSNGDQIVFSQGNLQYKDGTGWRFAEHQWDFVGAWNTSDWVDLFGWGTWGEGQNPLNTSKTDGDYSWSSDFSGTLINATSEGWYTPSTDIYNYIFNTRSTPSGIRYAKAKVSDFEGVILLPDNWNSSIYALNNANISGASYTSNEISLSDWTDILEPDGAVFIPRASMRDGNNAGPGGDGHYWTTSPGYAMHITNSDLSSSYGYCYKYYGFSVRLVQAAPADPVEPYVLQQDEDGNYLLGSVQDWQAFAELVKTTPTANAKMTADINLGDDQTMIGSLSVPYAGIFDGQGHTLTVNYNIYSVETAVAPFACVNGATILNLHVAGSIRQRRCAAGGVVGSVNGNLTVKKCWVSATLTVDGEGNYQGTIGGIASCCDNSSVQGKSILLEDCLFSGYVATGIHCGGLMSHVHGESYNNSAAFNNCLNIGTCNGPSGSTGTFIRTGVQGDPYTITNCYYKTAWRDAQGAQATETELADGTTTAALQNSREEEIWVQEGEMPMLKIFASEITPVEPTGWENGVLPGKFTINANGDQIVFSQGNLQYQASTDTWRFAINQYDMIGGDNTYISDSYDGWIDLIQWGAGNNPTTTATYKYDTFVEFGSNPISNGGEETDVWRTMTKDEWVYIFWGRTNAESLFGLGAVNGVNGVIILPDNWTTPDDLTFNPSTEHGLVWQTSTGYYKSSTADGFSHNVYTSEQWATMESNGAVFLPAAGIRYIGTKSIQQLGTGGYYWSSVNSSSTHAYVAGFGADVLNPQHSGMQDYGHSIRLVQAVPGAYVPQQDEDGYYLLSTVQDMFAFAALVNDGNNTANAKVLTDIDLAGNEDNQWTPIGTESNKYKGTFDGQGYAIKNLYWHGNNQLNIGFFGYVDGAKIMNLRLEDADIYNPGQDGTTGKFVGGMVGHSSNGNTLVINCSFSGSVTGMLEVGSMIGGGPAKVINCYNEGTVTFTSQTHYASGGILGYNSNGVTINNCYNVGDVINNGNPTDYMGAICYHGVTNSYYRENCCQNGSAAGWSNQGPGTVMSLDNMKTVLFVATLNVNVASLQATYPDICEWVQDPVTNLPILKIFAKAHDLVENQLEQDEDGNYLIGSVQDWKDFAALVNGGSVTANAKMTADIDLGDDQTMVGSGTSSPDADGSTNIKYRGTFDGQGHTLTIHYVAEDNITAPFRFIQEATIKNLRVNGNITTAYHHAGGIVGTCLGQYKHSYIENCISSVHIISSYVNTSDFYGGAMHGGIAATLNYYGQLHITDCMFNGSISGENIGVVWGGMLGMPDGTATFTNCLQIGTFGCNNVIGGSNGSGTFSTIFSNGYASQVNISNCHFLNAIGNIQGTQATVAQLADGTTANALQAGREEEIWVQNGTMPMLKLFASEIAPVEPSDWENGVLPGKFTINANGDKIVFSQGNLQYFCSTTAPEWRFAEHQYDYVPFDMSAYAANSEKWIDLFAYGTSGYDNGQTNYQPYVVGANPNTYYQGNLTGNAEWGYNAISNGGNTENFGWRTLTRDEWIYLFSGRTDAASKYGHGSINWVHGMIILPDDWTTPDGLSFTPGNSVWQNAYTIEQWSLMEEAGAVFLPASGSCNNVGIPSESLQNQNGFYRASTAAYYVYFGKSRLEICIGTFYQYGDAIRLVQAAQEETPTGVESIQPSEGSNLIQKILRDGQIFILRGDKIYNVVGTVVR